MRYDLEADWYLLSTCNFRCPYCFISPEELGAGLRTYGDAAEWARAFDRTGFKWLVHITGGEPFIYPRFPELCQALVEHHYISLNSNLSGRQIATMARIVDPKRVHYINAGLHHTERERHGDLEQFLQNAQCLRDAGFNVWISVVVSPLVAARWETLSESVGRAGFPLVPKLLRGPYAGKVYPAAYSQKEQGIIEQALKHAREHAGLVATWMDEPPTIDLFGDIKHLRGYPDFRGRPCESGRRFVRLAPDGTAYRCGTDQSLGNILRGDLQLLKEPGLCDTSYCPHFCAKYAS